MDTISVAKETETGRRRGECVGCGRTDKTLTAPKPNAGKGYAGVMYCVGCNPRFAFLDAHYTCLERLVR